MYKISVVIPLHNAEDVIEKTLAGLECQSLLKNDFEVILVDDCGSHTGIQQAKRYLQQSALNFSIVSHEKNRGTYASYNTGFNNSTGQIVLFLDQDCIPNSYLLEEHCLAHQECASPTVIIGSFLWHKEMKIGTYLRFFVRMQIPSLTEPQDILNMEVEQFITGNCSIKREDFIETGGFDEEFIYGFGDTEFGYRWLQKGHRLVGRISAVVYHLHQLDFPAQLQRKRKIGTQTYLYCQKHPELSHPSGFISAHNKKYMDKLYNGILEYFYHLGIRESLGIASDREKALAELLLEQEWDNI